MRIVASALLLALAAPLCLAQTLATPADSGPGVAPKKPVIFDLTGIDKSADPCTNFYQYACGNWMKNNPIPSDQARWSRFNELSERNNYLRNIELKAAADAPKSALQRQYGDYFAACMNTAEVDKLGVRALEPELEAIASLSSSKDLAAFNARQTKRGGGGFFGVAVTQDQKDSSQQIAATGQGGLTLPDRDYYLNPDARFATIRKQYMDHMVKMFTRLGDTDDKAVAEANDVMQIETALAKGAMTAWRCATRLTATT